VILAKEGDMIPASNKQFLIFRLEDGWRYSEGTATRGDAQKYQQTRMYFRKWDKIFDLSSFKLSRTNEDLFKGAYQMMNVRQLNDGIDSIKRYEKKIYQNVASYLNPYLTFGLKSKDQKVFATKVARVKNVQPYDSTFLEIVADSLRAEVIQTASSNLRNSKGLLDITSSDKRIQNENYLKFNIEWHRKFTLSFACVLLFLIGAPLGAIIRRGGLGMPMVIAIAFFIVFHIMSITGEKLAKTASIEPWAGMWMAAAMLLPIAFFLINASRKDSQIFTKEWYTRKWTRMRKLIANRRTND
jgi:lipopolysaccharide export system permease protein